MNKYFVYVESIPPNNKKYLFVPEDDINSFSEGLDRKIVEFSGVAIEADSHEEAVKTYHRPFLGQGTYIACDDPIVKKVDKKELLRSVLEMQMAYKYMKEANRCLRFATEALLRAYGTTGSFGSANKVFEEMANNAVKDTIRYDGDTTTT